MDKMQEVAFQMIAQVGTAKSIYIEALQEVKKGNIEQGEKMLVEADEIFAEAHSLHFDIVQKEANGEQLPFSVLFMHAEDQLLSTETIKLLIVEIIELYKNK